MRIGTQKILFDSGSFANFLVPAGEILSSSVIDCSDWNSCTVYVTCSSSDPASQARARTFISPETTGPFYPVNGSGQSELGSTGLTSNFTYAVDLSGARRFYVDFTDMGAPAVALQVTSSVVVTHERGMTIEKTVVSGLSNPMTAPGDMIYNNLSSTEDRLALGAEGEVLQVQAGLPAWGPAPAGATFDPKQPEKLSLTGVGSAGVSSDSARADHTHAVDTSLKSLDSATWTALVGNTGTATFTAGTGSITVLPAQGGATMNTPITFCSPFFPALEYIAQVTRTSTPSVPHRQNIGITNAAGSIGFLAQLDSGNLISCFYANTANSWQFFASAGVVTPWNDGLLWMRIILTPAYVSMWQGSGATTPTSWTLIGQRDISGGLLGAINGNITHLQFNANKDAGGTGTYTTTVDNVQCRSLLGAPV